MATTNLVNRQFRLKRRPEGRVGRDNFDFVVQPVADLGPGEALVRVLYLSLDPTNRIWMSDMDQYMPPVEIGAVMRGGGLGQVIASTHPEYQVGDIVSGLVGWQDYVIVSPSAPFAPRPLPRGLDLPLPLFMGVLGMTGLTAYFGLTDLGQPKPGETLVVSAAAGAVGSVVGQIGKILGCRVVGIAGGAEKCAWLTRELGFDAAVDYKSPSWRDDLARATPNGIDIDFENVGGAVMDAVIERLNQRARIVLCGLISSYNTGEGARADLTQILMKRARIEGFIIIDYYDRAMEGFARLGQWVMEGRLKSEETIVDGLESAPDALNLLFDGGNKGKLMIKLADPAK